MHEVKYEKEKFLISLMNIVGYISKNKPLYMILNRLHLSNISTVEFLLNYMKHMDNARVGIFVTYDKSIDVKEYMKKTWDNLLAYVEDNELDFDLSSFVNLKGSQTIKQFVPKVEEAKDYIQKLNNMMHCMACEQADS